MKFLDKEQRQQIGFSYVIDNMEILTPYGMEQKRNIKPLHHNKLIEELEILESMVNKIKLNSSKFREIEHILMKFKDITSTVRRVEAQQVLDDVELYEIKYFCILSNALFKIVNELDVYVDKVSFSALEQCEGILDPNRNRIPNFHVYDEYSEKLQEIRRRKRCIEEEVYKEKEESVIVRLKEQRLELVISEEEEELSVRRVLSANIVKHIDEVYGNIHYLGRLDFLIAKAKLAMKNENVKPQISREKKIIFKDIYNPEIREILQKKQKQIVPISVELGDGTSIITGANMGGKSVTLKTIVLNLLLAQMGFYIFGEVAIVPVLDFIYYISDDMQNILKGLSTYGAEIIALKNIIKDVKCEFGFVALDEFARGTNPREGKYLVKSLGKFLNKYKTISIIATHYDDVAEDKMVHYQVIGLKYIDFDELKYKIDLNKKYSIEIIQENMDYRLEKVNGYSEVPKDAFNIAVLLGLENEIVDIARAFYDKETSIGTGNNMEMHRDR